MISTTKGNNSKKYLILDTCIIQATGHKDRAKSNAFALLLRDLTLENFNLAISEMSVFENLHGLWGEQAKNASSILREFEWKIVSIDVLMLAGLLGGLYYDEKFEHVSAGDKIIAATAILEKGYILTENHRDFPQPFFLVEKYIPLAYETRPLLSKTFDLAIYKPNTALINRRIAEKDKN